MSRILSLRDVERTYGEPPVAACAGVSLEIDDGEFVAIVGPSGSGKSTLLNLIGTLDRPSAGTVEIDGVDVGSLSDAKLSALRASRIGFVFQQFHLADGVNAVDNVADGLLYSGIPRSERRRRARAALERVGLAHRLDHRPHQMSGGERQRVAIARAVVGDGALRVLFQPHLYSRTANFADRFAEALSLADDVVVTAVYAAREDPTPGVEGDLVTSRMDPARAQFVPDRFEAARALAARACPGDLVMTVGAGDVTELGPTILDQIGQR